jgi:hypothetical protein
MVLRPGTEMLEKELPKWNVLVDKNTTILKGLECCKSPQAKLAESQNLLIQKQLNTKIIDLGILVRQWRSKR